MLQLFGGEAQVNEDGTRNRGDIHILLMGDPGVAKSQLLHYMSTISPRGRFASGQSASAAGLTAAAVQDAAADGRWTREAGALVLADLGLAAIDEFDKMNTADRSSMHEAMEQQTISFWSTSFLRGTTLNNSIIIVDECQNLSFHELDSIITRVGKDCKIIFAGDIRQTDLVKSAEKNGILNFMEILEIMDEFVHVEFDVDDIVRSGLVRSYLLSKLKLKPEL